MFLLWQGHTHPQFLGKRVAYHEAEQQFSNIEEIECAMGFGFLGFQRVSGDGCARRDTSLWAGGRCIVSLSSWSLRDPPTEATSSHPLSAIVVCLSGITEIPLTGDGHWLVEELTCGHLAPAYH